MKKRLQGLIAGILIGTILTSGMVFAKKISETAELFYNNIKIYIDGGEIVPKDANGNVVEPFTMNGTTYLPVRAISNAFGKAVEWDGATQSVYIGKKDQTKPDNYLNKIQYNDYKEGVGDTDFAIINGTITDYNNTTYTNGLLFSFGNNAGWTPVKDDKDEATIVLSYPLNSQYRNLKGKIVLPKKEMKLLLLVLLILTGMVYLILLALNDTHPLLDSITTVFSVGGMYLTVRRAIEQWIFWMGVNTLSLFMWIHVTMNGVKAYSTVIMWAVYLFLAFYFYI